jgi:hypothetical protein
MKDFFVIEKKSVPIISVDSKKKNKGKMIEQTP